MERKLYRIVVTTTSTVINYFDRLIVYNVQRDHIVLAKDLSLDLKPRC